MELNNTLASIILYLIECSGSSTNVVTPMNLLFQTLSHLMYLRIMDFHHTTYTQEDTFWATWKGLCVKELCLPQQQFQVCIFYNADYFQIFVPVYNNFYLNPIIKVAWFSKQSFHEYIPVCYSSIFFVLFLLQCVPELLTVAWWRIV
jgi:hypothetical protein